jgi:hypothetical protein
VWQKKLFRECQDLPHDLFLQAQCQIHSSGSMIQIEVTLCVVHIRF